MEIKETTPFGVGKRRILSTPVIKGVRTRGYRSTILRERRHYMSYRLRGRFYMGFDKSWVLVKIRKSEVILNKTLKKRNYEA